MQFSNQTILISFSGYTSGHFIKTLVRQFITGDPNEILNFPENGTAHDVTGFTNNIPLTIFKGNNFMYYILPNYKVLEHNFHDYIMPLNSELFIWAEHTPPNWKNLFQKFPNSKNIIIQFSEKDLLRKIANLHYKYELYNLGSEKISSQTLEAIDHEQHVRSIHQNYIDSNTLCNFYKYPYHEDDIIPDEYLSKVYTLKMNDIMHNPDKVLNLLSIVTGRPCLPNFRINYDSYLKKQKELIPWLDDK